MDFHAFSDLGFGPRPISLVGAVMGGVGDGEDAPKDDAPKVEEVDDDGEVDDGEVDGPPFCRWVAWRC